MNTLFSKIPYSFSHEVPTRMLNLYFQFFTSEIQKKSKLMNQKILLGLLTGVNRAFPFAHLENNDSISKNIDQLYKLVHHGTFIVGLQSLSLLYQAFNTKEELSDRFYNAVYRPGHIYLVTCITATPLGQI